MIKLPYLLYVSGQTGLSKQCRCRSDAAKWGVWSGYTLFATHPAILHYSIRYGLWGCEYSEYIWYPKFIKFIQNVPFLKMKFWVKGGVWLIPPPPHPPPPNTPTHPHTHSPPPNPLRICSWIQASMYLDKYLFYFILNRLRHLIRLTSASQILQNNPKIPGLVPEKKLAKYSPKYNA